jgi:uncharacterized protein VirK/YbjX
LTQLIRTFGNGASLGYLKHSGKLRQRAIQLSYLACYWRAHSLYVEKLKKFQISDIIPHGSLLNYKYIGNYLAFSQGRRWRRDVIISNYQIIYNLMQRRGNSEFFTKSTVLWQLAPTEMLVDTLCITLQPSTVAPLEGEFELQFTVGEKLLATLTFVFASGKLVDTDHDAVCIVGSLQGGHDCRTEIRQASKVNGEISPFTMLILSVKALSQAMQIENVFGVSSHDQVALRGENRTTGLDYDAMWSREGGSAHPNGFHLLEPQAMAKPLCLIPQSHRKRAQRKRDRKMQISREICAHAFASLFSGRPGICLSRVTETIALQSPATEAASPRDDMGVRL